MSHPPSQLDQSNHQNKQSCFFLLSRTWLLGRGRENSSFKTDCAADRANAFKVIWVWLHIPDWLASGGPSCQPTKQQNAHCSHTQTRSQRVMSGLLGSLISSVPFQRPSTAQTGAARQTSVSITPPEISLERRPRLHLAGRSASAPQPLAPVSPLSTGSRSLHIIAFICCRLLA